MKKQYEINIHRNEWNCGAGCCREVTFEATIHDTKNKKYICLDTVFGFELDSDYNSEEEILNYLSEAFKISLTQENSFFN